MQFLSRFSASPDYRMLDAIFSKELASLDDECRTKEAPALYRSQGAAQWLVAFGKKMVTVKEELERLEVGQARRPHPPVNAVAGQSQQSTIRTTTYRP